MIPMFRPSKHLPAGPPGANIYRLRQLHDISYGDLAARIHALGGHIERSTIYRIEQGAAYSTATLDLIARGLGVGVPDLFGSPALLPLAVLPAPDRLEAEAKVETYIRDLAAAYRVHRRPT
jgi:transcriptional regulator with XRE-family HTH domain